MWCSRRWLPRCAASASWSTAWWARTPPPISPPRPSPGRARTTLGLLQTHLQISPERVALIVNRHDPRFHHGRTEIEWALGVKSACFVPYDHLGIERALAAQRPAVLGRGAAGKALLDLAERIHGGKVMLAPEPERAARRRWPRLPSLRARRSAEVEG
jgi:hypothetical protein